MKNTLLKTLGILAALVALLATVLVVRATTMESVQPEVSAPEGLPQVDDGAVERLAGAVRIPTVSPADYTAEQLEPFEELDAYLRDSFPRVHAELDREGVGPCSLMYTWEGDDPQAKPAVLMSHLDVVPVEDGEEADWTHPPFSGAVVDGYVWGRGTLDIKVGVLGILEATEALLEAGHKPRQTFIYAFGCDEEIGGRRGAKKIAELLDERDTRADYVLDEGLVITEGIMPGVDRPVALIGLAEKGFLTLNLTARAEGGHSSMPPFETAIGILSGAIKRIEDRQFDAYLNPPARQMFEAIGPEMPMAMRLVFANLWLLEPVLIGQLEQKKQTNATVRTTTAVTIFNGGVQDNILPKTARASVNFRIAPGQTVEDVKRHVETVIDDDRVEIATPEASFTSDPSPVSSTESAAFEHVRRTTRQVFGEETIVIPGLMVGGSDSRWFTDVADDVYRFIPTRLGADDTKRIHGVDERIGVENYENIVRYYMQLMRSE
ncbi:MAG: M20 family peptidase [Persicimonas sp.]